MYFILYIKIDKNIQIIETHLHNNNQNKYVKIRINNKKRTC